MATDSRTTLRFPLDLTGQLAVEDAGVAGSEVTVRIRNVSLGGLFAVGPQLTIGQRALVRFGGPGLPTIESPCIARWHDPTGTGLQFEGLRAADTYTLSKFLRASARTPALVTSPPAARSSGDRAP